MAIKIDQDLRANDLLTSITRLFELSAEKILSLEKSWQPSKGAPVFTVRGRYVSRGWTEWTQGFQFGSALLQFEATGDRAFLELGRSKTVDHMATHVSHMGVHDHGFNNISTYGNLLRLMLERRIDFNEWEKSFYELALKISGAVQAARWTAVSGDLGYIYSFNGPHSLFVDTLRSLRSLAVAHLLGHVLMGERDQKISLFERLVLHGETTAKYNVWYGNQRDSYDVRGRVAHESIFNLNDGSYRCPGTQQGYSPFSTWTRGLAWAILGYVEQLEFLAAWQSSAGAVKKTESKFTPARIRSVQATFLVAAQATADFYVANSCADGVPIWDTGAPNLHRLGDYLNKPANPYNEYEPIDSSAAVIASQGLLRLGNYLRTIGNRKLGNHYRQAGLTVARAVMREPYLSERKAHQGLILHSVYHRPNGWDYVAGNQMIPNGESSMWGDYHARELAVLILREGRGEAYSTFFAGLR